MLFALLLSFFGATSMMAQDEVTIKVDRDNGEWTVSNSVKTWATQWKSYSTPAITVTNVSNGGNNATTIRGTAVKGNNNMAYYDGTNIDFYTGQASSTAAQVYQIEVDFGWEISEISFDFTSSTADGTQVTLGDTEPVVSANTEDVQHVSFTAPEETYTVDMGVQTMGSANNFAYTTNFVVVVRKQSAWKASLEELMATIETYDGYRFHAGSEPGNYGVAETTAFRQAIETAREAVENPDTQDTMDAQDLDKLNDAIKEAYEAVLASRNMVLNITDGYYRIKTAMQYTETKTVVDEETQEETQVSTPVDKYLISYMNGTNFYGYYTTPEDVDFDCTTLWHIVNKDGYLDIQNMGTDARFKKLFQYNVAVPMSTTESTLMQILPAVTVDGTTYVNIRTAPQADDKYQYQDVYYYHQYGHNSGAGKGGAIGLYYMSNGVNEENEVTLGGSEWQLIPVDEATAKTMMANYEDHKNAVLMQSRYKTMLADAKEKLQIAKDQTQINLITSGDQFSSPNTETREGVGKSGNWGELLDGTNTTYWHSDWSASVDNHTHYLQVALVEPVSEEIYMRITRRPVANDHITLWGVVGSNDASAADEAWEELASLETPFGNNTETLIAGPFDSKGYKYLRFYIDGTTTGRGYGHVSEFQLFRYQSRPISQYDVMGEVGKNLNDVLEAQKDLELADLTAAQYDALKAAYDAFIEKFVDPTELRETLANVESVGEGVVLGTNPGFWGDKGTATTLANTVAAATAYDEAGAYTQEQTDKYVADLKAQSEAITAAANGIKEGKWYRIKFASEGDFEAHEWDKIAGYVAPAEGQEEKDQPLWDKYLAVANYVQIDKEAGTYEIEALDAEDATLGQNVFFDDDTDITDKGMSMFRFVSVGDSAYIIQNKATNLFLKAAGATGHVTMSVHPSLFNVKAVGYGFNVISAQNINGANQNYLHAQKSLNILVTWSANTVGTASAMYIEEAGDVAGDYTGEEFNLSVLEGEIAPYCFPVDITATEKGMYGVEVKDTEITLFPLESAAAGRPFIYIHGEDPAYYNAENEREMTTFKHGYNLVTEPQTDAALKGTFASIVLDRGEVYVDAATNSFKVNRVSKTAPMDYCEIAPNRAYISTEEGFAYNAELTINIDKNKEDGVAEVLNKVAKSGPVYTLDGRLVSKKGNVNDLRRYGKGIYILNGVKVVVK